MTEHAIDNYARTVRARVFIELNKKKLAEYTKGRKSHFDSSQQFSAFCRTFIKLHHQPEMLLGAFNLIAEDFPLLLVTLFDYPSDYHDSYLTAMHQFFLHLQELNKDKPLLLKQKLEFLDIFAKSSPLFRENLDVLSQHLPILGTSSFTVQPTYVFNCRISQLIEKQEKSTILHSVASLFTSKDKTKLALHALFEWLNEDKKMSDVAIKTCQQSAQLRALVEQISKIKEAATPTGSLHTDQHLKPIKSLSGRVWVEKNKQALLSYRDSETEKLPLGNTLQYFCRNFFRSDELGNYPKLLNAFETLAIDFPAIVCKFFSDPNDYEDAYFHALHQFFRCIQNHAPQLPLSDAVKMQFIDIFSLASPQFSEKLDIFKPYIHVLGTSRFDSGAQYHLNKQIYLYIDTIPQNDESSSELAAAYALANWLNRGAEIPGPLVALLEQGSLAELFAKCQAYKLVEIQRPSEKPPKLRGLQMLLHERHISGKVYVEVNKQKITNYQIVDSSTTPSSKLIDFMQYILDDHQKKRRHLLLGIFETLGEDFPELLRTLLTEPWDSPEGYEMAMEAFFNAIRTNNPNTLLSSAVKLQFLEIFAHAHPRYAELKHIFIVKFAQNTETLKKIDEAPDSSQDESFQSEYDPKI